MNKEISKQKFREEITIIRGAFYGSLGIVFRVAFLFFINLLLAKKLGAKSYGIWSLAFIILTFGSAIVLLGLEKGLSRFIGKYRGSGEKEKEVIVINSGIILVFVASLVISFLLFVFSSDIAELLNIKELSWLLKIISFALIPAGLVEIIGGVFQGYENIRISRLINSFVPNLFWLLLVTSLALLGKVTLFGASFSYLFPFWLAGATGLFFLNQLFSKKEISVPLKIALISAKKIIRPLLFFSFPLLLFNFLNLVSVHIDSLLIGYFLGPYKVGIYNVAFRIARLSPLLLLGTVDIFTPLISKNLAKKDYQRHTIQEFYQRATKWAFVPTLLIILTLIIFSDFFLGLFNKEFLEGSFVLRLLLISYLIYALVGPTEAMNIALGKTKFVASYTLVGGIVSLALNFLLIPKFGIEGAAVVAILTMILVKTIASLKLKIKDKITFFQKNYIVFVIFSILLGLGTGLLINQFISSNIFGIILFVFLFGLFELLLLKKLNLIDEKDIVLKDMILEKVNIK